MKLFTIAIGSDHAGFAYKEAIKALLLAEGHTVRDFGTQTDASCDYPDFIRPTAEAVAPATTCTHPRAGTEATLDRHGRALGRQRHRLCAHGVSGAR